MAMFNYESEALYQQVKGETLPSSPVYVSECKKEIIDEVSPNYPQLVEYEKEWLNFAKHIYHGGTPVPLEYQEVETDDFATVNNAIPFYYKSAILKGQTLIDLKDSFENGTYAAGVNKVESKVRIRSVNKFTEIGTFTFSVNSGYQLFIQGYNSERNEQWGIGWDSTITLVTTSGDIFGIVIKRNDEAEMSVDEFERIGFTTNLFISGDLVSVKMPVLSTTGKNLFDVEGIQKYGGAASLTVDEKGVITIVGGGTDTESSVYTNKTVYLEKGKQYTFSCVTDGVFDTINGTDTVEAFLMEKGGSQAIQNLHTNPRTFTCTSTGDYTLRLDVNMGTKTHTFSNIQVEEGSQATFYEPFKSNILTVNEPVELRGIGDVKDELDLLTGEVTECIGEIALDGSDDENWLPNNSYVFDGQICYKIKLTDMNANMVYPTVLCDKLPYILKGYGGTLVSISTYQNDLFVRLNGNTKEDLKRWLSENPLTVHYPLKSESIKTVDLSTSIKPYDDINHYHVSSDTIPPHLSLSVPVVSTGAQTLNDIITEG